MFSYHSEFEWFPNISFNTKDNVNILILVVIVSFY